MRRLRVPHIWFLFGVTLLSVHAVAQTAKNKEVPFPPELSEQAAKDFEFEDCFQEGQRPIEKQVKTEEISITPTTNTVLLLTGDSPCLSRGDNHAYLLYARFGKDWRKILRADGASIQQLPSMTGLWHDLEVVLRKSETDSDSYVYRFSKTEYIVKSCEAVTERAGKAQREPCPGWKGK